MNYSSYQESKFVNIFDDDLMISSQLNDDTYNVDFINNNSHVIKCWFDLHNGTNRDYDTLFTIWLIMHIVHVFLSFMFPNVLHSAHIRRDRWQTYINILDLYIILNSFILIVPYYFNSSTITNIYLVLTNGCYWYLYLKLLNRIHYDMYITMLFNHLYLGFITVYYLHLDYY